MNPNFFTDIGFPIELDDGRVLREDDVQEVVRLLNHPVRSRHACISKGQLHEVIDQLIARNALLENHVKRIQAVLDEYNAVIDK